MKEVARDEMLIVKSFGGLGNQMFQYVLYQYLKECNNEVYFDISDFECHKYHNGFELENLFEVEFDKPTKRNLKKVTYNHNNVFLRLLNKLFKSRLVKDSEFFETMHGIHIPQGTYEKNLYLVGYWQSAKYVESVASVLRKQFVFKKEMNEQSKKIASVMMNTNSISVHVRCGDYINNTTLGGICDREYYEKAIHYLKEEFDDCHFFVFSDDIEWVKKNLIVLKEANYIDWNRGDNSWCDMQLMSMCKHNIIANSTFSWWGAWLNLNEDKIVIMPKKWFQKQSTNLLECKGWIMI